MYRTLFLKKFIKLNVRHNNTCNSITKNTICECKISLKYKYPIIGIIFLVGSIIEYITFKETKDISKSTGLGWATIIIIFTP